MSVIIEYTCKKHPKYQGKMQPRIDCEGCYVVHAFAANADKSPPYTSPNVKIERVEQLP